MQKRGIRIKDYREELPNNENPLRKLLFIIIMLTMDMWILSSDA
jgi:hypothetical protein